MAKTKGVPRAAERLGDRTGRLAVEVDVEDGDVDVGGLGRRQRLLDLGGLRRHRKAEVVEHVLDQHADHDVVLDDQDALGRLTRSHSSAVPNLEALPVKPARWSVSGYYRLGRCGMHAP